MGELSDFGGLPMARKANYEEMISTIQAKIEKTKGQIKDLKALVFYRGFSIAFLLFLL